MTVAQTGTRGARGGMRILFSQHESMSCNEGETAMQISGSSAIVVGGGGGLGEATVRRLHAAGAKVVVADLADEKGKALADELDARYVRTDATNTEDVNAAFFG
jgi:D-arabinose 1-dehydrogenase-like Zn-dependent alcohol dehydrogenase